MLEADERARLIAPLQVQNSLPGWDSSLAENHLFTTKGQIFCQTGQ